MKILIKEEQLKLIEQIKGKLEIPSGYMKVSNKEGFIELGGGFGMNCYLYYNPEDYEFYHIGIGPDGNTRVVKAIGDMYDISNIYDNRTKTNAEDIKNQTIYKKTGKLPIIKNSPVKPKSINPNAPKTNNAVKPNAVSAVKRNPEEQRWVGIWEKFLVKYLGFTGGDKDNLTSDIDNAVYKFITKNRKLYEKNANIKNANLEKLMTDGKKGKVHDSFLPPFYYKTDKFPIYFYQKSDKIMEIQKKLGVKQTGIFLNQTESAIVKRIKVKNSQGYNIKYDRNTGITQEIYNAIMSGDKKNEIGTPKLIPTKQNTSLEPVSNNTDLSNKIK
jgi:hypothetical protein